jgi:hypothetical protein
MVLEFLGEKRLKLLLISKLFYISLVLELKNEPKMQ